MLVEFVCLSQPNITTNATRVDPIDLIAKQKQWPKAYIGKIYPNGTMQIKFNQKMNVP